MLTLDERLHGAEPAGAARRGYHRSQRRQHPHNILTVANPDDIAAA
jgi:hypothetical protein